MEPMCKVLLGVEEARLFCDQSGQFILQQSHKRLPHLILVPARYSSFRNDHKRRSGLGVILMGLLHIKTVTCLCLIRAFLIPNPAPSRLARAKSHSATFFLNMKRAVRAKRKTPTKDAKAPWLPLLPTRSLLISATRAKASGRWPCSKVPARR